MKDECSTTLWKVPSIAAALILLAAAPTPGQDLRAAAPTAPSCGGVQALASAPAEQYASYASEAVRGRVATQEVAAAAGSPVRAEAANETKAMAERIARIRDSGQPVSVQASERKDMVYLDKVMIAAAKVSASLDQAQSQECTELGLVFDDNGSVGCSETLGACFETFATPCTDAPGIPEDTFCNSWACRWW